MSTKQITFKNLIESCQSLSNGNIVSVTPTNQSIPRAFSATNARGEAVIRTRSQVRSGAVSIARLMCASTAN